MTSVISEHIKITPGVCGGKPRLAGHRIRVQDIAICYDHLNTPLTRFFTITPESPWLMFMPHWPITTII
jgi:hypothetical protein